MARGGKKGSRHRAYLAGDPAQGHRRRKEHLDYDTSRARTVLAVVGVALLLVLLWLDSRGY